MRTVLKIFNILTLLVMIYTIYTLYVDKIKIPNKTQMNKVNVSFDEIKGIDKQKEWIKKVMQSDQKPNGILLYGPPGTGKTMLAKAICTHFNGNFIPVTAAMLQSKFYGETPKIIENLFHQAEKNKPSVLFFDEMDGLFNTRDFVFEQADRTMKTTLLSSMDGLIKREGIMCIGATNRLDDLDPAIKRRFRMQIEVPLPDKEVISEMLCIKGSGTQYDELLNELVEKNFSCSDIEQLNILCKIEAGPEKIPNVDNVNACIKQFF